MERPQHSTTGVVGRGESLLSWQEAAAGSQSWALEARARAVRRRRWRRLLAALAAALLLAAALAFALGWVAW